MHARLCHLPSDRFTTIDLMHDAPSQNPQSSSYLLAALADEMPKDAICIAVVDPGVGTTRDPAILAADNRIFIGPDNGLLEIPSRRAHTSQWHRIDWRPGTLSTSFHGRDLFAPVAAALALEGPDWRDRWSTEVMRTSNNTGVDWPDDILEIIYCDAYGNCISGLRASAVSQDAVIRTNGHEIHHAKTFGAVTEGSALWYENSMGLIEVAVNKGRASDRFNLAIGSPIHMI